jgi:excisionase family DNA binding protein
VGFSLVGQLRSIRSLYRALDRDAEEADPGQLTPPAEHPDLSRLAVLVETLERRLPPLLLSIADAAEHLRISVSSVRRLIKARKIPHVKLGGVVRVDLSRLGQIDVDGR